MTFIHACTSTHVQIQMQNTEHMQHGSGDWKMVTKVVAAKGADL
ncbi:hypothetical protein DOY81_000747 [Sarcophaga bullata]|nr:hypothetical protein DOY81_000747 [Sarcophaga bullata]